MPRTARASVANHVYHVLSRGNRRETVFLDDTDFSRFRRLMQEANERIAMRMLTYCIMSNHFHFVLWPRRDEDLAKWMHWLLTSYVRWHHRRYDSEGHLWQGRFKAFPIQNDAHLLTVLRYVDSNPVRANLVHDVRDWHWGAMGDDRIPLSEAPIERPQPWTRWVNEPQTFSEEEAMRECIARGRPYGEAQWVEAISTKLDLTCAKNPRGRPRKK